jgi:transcription elongation factor GreB
MRHVDPRARRRDGAPVSAEEGEDAAPGSPRPAKRYVTREGYRRLADELDRLWRLERPRVTREVADAAALGDRSENAEYIFGKKRLREIDRRIRFLSKRLDELVVVAAAPERRDRVYFGAFVTLEDDAGETLEVRLAGPDEFDAATGRISLESPLGRALIGKGEGDEFVFRRPKGPVRYTVAAVRYEGD